MKCPLLIVTMLAAMMLCGCQATPTTQPTTLPTTLQQLQTQHDQLLGTLQFAESAYAIAVAFGVVSAQDQAIAATADKAANDALTAMQTAINAGDANGADVAVKAFEAALADFTPVMTRAQPAMQAKLKALHH